jgi:8-oxo-dGTP pyrophosphatase MutT (NUDIX family)
MYKVFIENTSLHIVESKDFIPKDVLVIFEGDIELVKVSLFQSLKSVDNHLPIYIVSSSPESTFSKLFEDFDCIEAAGGIVKRKDSFLFIKRNGKWDIPKGKLEKGENSEVAAVREIEEECGISGHVIENMIGITYHTYEYKRKPVIKKTYWYELKYDGIKQTFPQIEEGITKVKWFKLDQISKVKKCTYLSILEVIATYFERK